MGLGIQHLYASDLGRAVQTARPIAARLGLEVTTDARLREQSFGDLEGSWWKDLEENHPDAHALLARNDFHERLPGGESRADPVARALDVMNEIAQRHDGGTVAVVTHGGLLRFFLRAILRVPEGTPHVARIPNCAVSEFWRREGGWVLCSWASTQHL